MEGMTGRLPCPPPPPWVLAWYPNSTGSSPSPPPLPPPRSPPRRPPEESPATRNMTVKKADPDKDMLKLEEGFIRISGLRTCLEINSSGRMQMFFFGRRREVPRRIPSRISLYFRPHTALPEPAMEWFSYQHLYYFLVVAREGS